MWGDSSFDDGGFMNGTQNTTSASKPKKEQVKRTQSVVSLVTRQILDCPTEEFTLFDLPVQIVQLVGILRNFDLQSTKATWMVEDFSGSIKAVLWLETENETMAELPPVKENCYAQVFGSIRNQDGEKIIMILKMIPVDDCNIITTHLLQFLHTRLEAEAMSTEEAIPFNKPSTSSMSAMDNEPDVLSFSSGLTPIQRQVFHILRPAKDCVGVSKDMILKNFGAGQEHEVKEALSFFLMEGYAYTTIDNDHFKLTEGFS